MTGEMRDNCGRPGDGFGFLALGQREHRVRIAAESFYDLMCPIHAVETVLII